MPDTPVAGWQFDGSCLTRSYNFPDFGAAMRFMQACVAGIEAHDHHPEWSNVYNRVSIKLTTHDAGNTVTEKDIELARYLQEHANVFGGK